MYFPVPKSLKWVEESKMYLVTLCILLLAAIFRGIFRVTM
ncbi:Protein of unknown function [Pyronema omphalodes CBS 100304]|uniref:Uncharacterized protein n=1 Tax=Pyronema omphalodes (strain CBS 100304) TaxID=1076935 RepID=U4LV27_PYROM|nr:Protein of unknown function [Pyronema omphalodes CBS 100304]